MTCRFFIQTSGVIPTMVAHALHRCVAYQLRMWQGMVEKSQHISTSLSLGPVHYGLNVCICINMIGWYPISKFDTSEWEWSWRRHHMETFSALLTICAGNSAATGEFPAQRLLTRSFDVFFDLRLNKRLSKQWRGWWFEAPSRPLWRHCNGDGK